MTRVPSALERRCPIATTSTTTTTTPRARAPGTGCARAAENAAQGSLPARAGPVAAPPRDGIQTVHCPMPRARAQELERYLRPTDKVTKVSRGDGRGRVLCVLLDPPPGQRP
jgi:hypothetical protein